MRRKNEKKYYLDGFRAVDTGFGGYERLGRSIQSYMIAIERIRLRNESRLLIAHGVSLDDPAWMADEVLKGH